MSSYLRLPALIAPLLLAANLPPGARGDAINILSETHHVWGHIQDVSYDILQNTPVAGDGQKYVIADGEGWVTMSSSTLGSHAGAIVVDAAISSGEPWGISNGARAEVIYEFTSNTSLLDLDFAGFSGDHFFESGLYYELYDIDGGFALDARSWEYEMGLGWVDDVLPYSGAYAVIPMHTYRLTVGAYAELGDGRLGFAHLDTTITPEPTALALLLIGGVAAARRP